MRGMSSPVVVITGASSGIGRATALAFAPGGATVVLAARRIDRLRAVADEVRTVGGHALVVPTDVTVRHQVEALIHRAVAECGRLDILVNNAGSGLYADIESTTAEDLEQILAVNLFGTLYGITAALSIMRRQGSGRIINVASLAGKRGMPAMGAYSAAKFAVVGLTEALRVETLGSGVAVSLICPGPTAGTEFSARAIHKARQPTAPVRLKRTAEQVAMQIVRCARHPRAEVVPYRLVWSIAEGLNILVPGLVDRLLRRVYAASR